MENLFDHGSPLSTSLLTSAPTHTGRQRPGMACHECRRRKLRCDGQQPQCGMCRDSGVLCEVNPHRAPRGPKKGNMKALRNRIEMLENRLAEQQQQQQHNQQLHPLPHHQPPPPTFIDGIDSVTTTSQSSIPLSAASATSIATIDLNNISDATSICNFSEINVPLARNSVPTRSMSTGSSTSQRGLPTLLPGISSHARPPTAPDSNLHITELMHAELDQLYFDRVHSSIPILHQRRYLSWSRLKDKKASRACLQYAMWTLTTLFSSQFQHLQEVLYLDTKYILESHNLSNSDQDLDTEQVQAWILLATYESMRTYHRLAWMSAGRAFRLIQLMGLYEIDVLTNSVPPEEFIQVEEQRRVFWMAYFLDHLFSMRNNWPVTLNEHVIGTRLPASEVEFQSGKLALGSLLSEAIIESTPKVHSAFNECIILVTICGRSLFYGQQYNIRSIYGDLLGPDWPEHHQWLDDILETRLQIPEQHYPSPMDAFDPMLLFANIIGQATAIYLFKGIKTAVSVDQRRSLVMEHQQRALAAAERIVDLGNALTEFQYFKIHPLMPMPLFLCAEFLYTNQSSHASFKLCLEDLLCILRRLKNVNNPDQSYVQLLEASCTSTSQHLAKHASGSP